MHGAALCGGSADPERSRLFSLDGDIVALTRGVEPGEQVITDGAQYLEDGEQVALAEPLAEVRGAAHRGGLR